MQFFIDTANAEEIKTAHAWGLVDGVTTNPSLVAKEGRDFKQVVMEICEIVDGPISAEVISLESDKMIVEAKELASWHKNIIVKIPCTPDGLKAVKELTKQKIKTNVTLVFSANQVLLAAKAGATYISPFVGRLDDAGEDGLQMIEDSLAIIKNYNFTSKILVASIRSPLTVQKAAMLGAHVATIPFKVLQQLFKHPLTDVGIQTFLSDWAKSKS
ncbi:MAG: hypothetical protein ACD_72C00090G0001 [uncultured bacterium]|nr:MAG: hypothetical protein ACD_72C00090G0001 [uncultured bacterium]